MPAIKKESSRIPDDGRLKRIYFSLGDSTNGSVGEKGGEADTDQ